MADPGRSKDWEFVEFPPEAMYVLLVKLNKPNKGLVYPMDFITTDHETKNVTEITTRPLQF